MTIKGGWGVRRLVEKNHLKFPFWLFEPLLKCKYVQSLKEFFFEIYLRKKRPKQVFSAFHFAMGLVQANKKTGPSLQNSSSAWPPLFRSLIPDIAFFTSQLVFYFSGLELWTKRILLTWKSEDTVQHPSLVWQPHICSLHMTWARGRPTNILINDKK